MVNILFDIVKLVQIIIDFYYYPHERRKIIKNVPYFFQKETGAPTEEESVKWRENGCGLVCLKTILAYKYKKVIPIYKLGRICEKYGGYKANSYAKGGYDGLFLKPFANFIYKEFGLNSKIITPMTVIDIVKELGKNKFVIVSVSSEIENPKTPPKRKGGHLILLLGYDFDKKILIYNNTGYNKKQAYQKISFSDFESFFAYRGISIW